MCMECTLILLPVHVFINSLHSLHALQGLCQCFSSGLSDHLDSIWVQEVKRAFADGMCRTSDCDWIQSYAESLNLSKVQLIHQY